MNKLIDMSGLRIGRLLVQKQSTVKLSGRITWDCLCDCGTVISTTAKRLRNGMTKSCGCLRSDSARQTKTKHGMFGTPTYNIWGSMIQRCHDPNSRGYTNYGGRGITVCASWRIFTNFFADMGEKPPGLSLERLNNELGYNKNNCKWATPVEQANNTRRSVRIQVKGKEYTIPQAISEFNSQIPRSTILGRLKAGWEPMRAMQTPIDPSVTRFKKGQRHAKKCSK